MNLILCHPLSQNAKEISFRKSYLMFWTAFKYIFSLIRVYAYGVFVIVFADFIFSVQITNTLGRRMYAYYN